MSQTGYKSHLIREKLRMAARKGHDISYQDIADATGLAYMTVHRYATKVIPRPDFETVLKLAGYFGVPVEDFVYSVAEETETPEVLAVAAP